MSSQAIPRAHSSRSDLPNRTQELYRVSEAIGLPLLPWVVDAFDVLTEYEPHTEEPRFRQALCTVPRQSGKSVMVATLAIEYMLRNPEHYGIYVAQSRTAATSRLRTMATFLRKSRLDAGAKVTLGVGNERIRFTNGSVIEVHSPTADAIHGESVDLALMDELFAIDSILMTAVSPAMAARPRAQLWMVSTAGTLADSHLLNELTEQGRANPDGPMGFVEYSLPEDASPYDEARWPEFHPGLGHTTTIKHLATEAQTMKLPAFVRSYGNIPTAQEAEAIPKEWWEASAHTPDEIGEPITLAVDVSDGGAAIAAAYPGELEASWHADVIEHRAGADPTWVIERMRELTRDLRPNAIAADGSGPTGALYPDLRSLCDDTATDLLLRTAQIRARGDVFTYELLRTKHLTHNTLAPLDDAVAGIGTETAGDLWRFSRKKAIVDTSPLIALSLAVYAAHEKHQEPTPAITWG